MELMNPLEEITLMLITEHWNSEKRKISIMDVRNMLESKGWSLSHEKVRLIVGSLWRKGNILVDVQGRERMIRPNHVVINSRSKPMDIRNFTIIDEETGTPVQRIWVSIYEDKSGRYFSISESRWNGTWKTTSNIIIPPNAVEEFEEILEFIKENINKKKDRKE